MKGSRSLFLNLSGWTSRGATRALTPGWHGARSFTTPTFVCDQTVFMEGNSVIMCECVCVESK